MADEFRTQDAPVTGRVLYSITFPDCTWFVREFLDLFYDMTREYNWTKVGTVSVHDATQAAETAYWSVSKMVGTIIPYITSDAPSNALPCDGAQYLRADYPVLYAALDSAFVVDADNFVVPDLRGRTLVGAGSGTGLTPRAVNDSGGEETHQLTSGEMPTHSHTPSGHIHSIHSHIDLLAFTPGELPVSCPNPLPESTSNGWDTIGDTGGGGFHENIPAFLGRAYAG